MRLVYQTVLREFIDRLDAVFARPARIYLIGETIQQDPAEFKRKYKGLLQMWRAVRPGTTHRHTSA